MTKEYYQATLLYNNDNNLKCKVLITTKDFEKAKKSLLKAYKKEIKKVNPEFLKNASDKDIEDFYLVDSNNSLEWHDVTYSKEGNIYSGYEFISIINNLQVKGFINLITI